MRISYFSLCLIIILFSTSTPAAKDLMDPVVVTATKVKTQDTKATYASEVYSREDIEKSGAVTIYDFFQQNTSAAIMPSYGNTFNQMIDIRGFGLTDGYKNIAITVNGRRLNNIDSVGQQLSDIPINNIERIEITKGSGSVVHGDGATGGSIQIYTRDTTETSLETSIGNYGIHTQSYRTGISEGKFILSASGANYSQGGFSDKGLDGFKDKGESHNHGAKLKYFPTESSEIFFQIDWADHNIRYPNALTSNTFEQNPGSSYKTTSGVKSYTLETAKKENYALGTTIEIGNNLEANLSFNHQQKDSQTRDGQWPSSTNKEYTTNTFDSSLKYQDGPLKVITGIQTWYAERLDKYGTAEKDNKGVFIQSEYSTGNTVFSFGTRGEWVHNSFTTRASDISFIAYDIGVNKTLNDRLSVFSNLNYAFLAPDVDRWFIYNGPFNEFIDPTKSTTLNIGGHHVTSKNKAKLTLYAMELSNEQIYNPITGKNTNIDKSFKYGLELQDKYIFNNQLSARLNYAYTGTFIDFEPSTAETLPGVSPHNITIGLEYAPASNSRALLTQNYRSESLHLEDFADNGQMKNSAYTSTDISYTHIHKTESTNALFKKAELTLRVENLFEQSNGLWLRDDVIYPTKFTRNVSLGAKFNF